MQGSIRTSSTSHTDYFAESHKPNCGSMNSVLSLGVDGDKSYERYKTQFGVSLHIFYEMILAC